MKKPPISFDVIIDNLAQIAAALSDGVAARVLYEIWKRLSGAFGTEAWSVCEKPWGVTVTFNGEDAVKCLQAELMEAARRPVTSRTQRIVTSLNVSFVDPGKAVLCPELDAVQYRIEMCAAAPAYEVLDAGKMRFAEQPVIGVGYGARPLYYECLARLVDQNSAVFLPGDYMGVLERLGLRRAFGWHVLREVVRQLVIRPDVVLGCNVSALSAVNDIRWTSALGELRRRPEIAERLVIEITETAALPRVVDAMAFVAAVQRTGARVALDDFGAGHSSADFAREAKVDIFKSDGSYLRNRLSGNGQHLLTHLVNLVSGFSPTVEVEGIERTGDLQTAIKPGAKFFPGYYFQAPKLLDPVPPSTEREKLHRQTIR